VSCPFCFSNNCEDFDTDSFRTYLLCKNCSIVFVSRDQLIPEFLEKKRYESHDNSENNPEYQNYLQKIADHISIFLPKGFVGLDFGCGKTKLLEKIIKEKGLEIVSYDVFFHNDLSVFEKRFNFIILSEVIEHLRNPLEEIKKLTSLLEDDGMIFIKTRLRPESSQEFRNWFYKRDITHIQFFSKSSFNQLSAVCNLSNFMQIDEDLFLFRNNLRKVT